MNKLASHNIRLVYLFSFFRMFLVIIPIIVPYMEGLGLSMREIFILQATFGIVVAIFEVPSGYACDIIGRKKTLVIGSFFSGLGFAWLYFCHSFWQLILFEGLIGFAMAMVSGADFSLLYDSIPHDDSFRSLKTHAVAKIQWAKTGAEAIGSCLSGLLMASGVQVILFAQVIAGWIPFFVSLFFIEPPRKRMEHSHGENLKRIWRHIFINDKFVRLIFVNLVIWGLSTFIAVWMFQKYWLEEGISIKYFGFIWAGYNLSVGLVGNQVHWLEKRFGAIPLLVGLSLLPVAGYLSMGYLHGWIGVTCGLLFQFGRGITQVILKDALNWRTPNEFRATVNSFISLFFRLGFFIIGPGVGYLIDRAGIQSAFTTLGIAFFILTFIITLPLIREVKKTIGNNEIPS